MDTKCRYLHETSLGHIIDIYDAIKDSDFDVTKLFNKKNGSNVMQNTSSIAKAASNLTMVFPVLCTKGISFEHASMISKAIERNCVSMLQRLFASWQVADSGDVRNLQDYISKFHKNLNTKVADLDDIFRIQDELTESYKEKLNSLELKAIKEDMQNINFVLPYHISESALHEESKPTRPNTLNNDNKNTFQNQVLNADYKKANELAPTTMVINFSYKTDDDADPVQYNSALAAVKAKLYPIGSDDIINHIADKSSNKNWITDFIRASTREISFVKDFVLAIDKAKIDALSLSNKNKTTDKLWKVLERRALHSKINRMMRSGNASSVAAITTLVTSQNEVEYLKKNYNVDIERVSEIVNLFTSLNLMSVVIVDESLEVAKFIYDESDPMWESISFNHLEREASDNSYKKVIDIISKMPR